MLVQSPPHTVSSNTRNASRGRLATWLQSYLGFRKKKRALPTVDDARSSAAYSLYADFPSSLYNSEIVSSESVTALVTAMVNLDRMACRKAG